MNYQIREMCPEDFDAVLALWRVTEHIDLNECDTPEGIAVYLKRNPGLSFVAEAGSAFAGVVLCGHDGRRGFLRHLAVAKEYRKQGMARALVERALQGLLQHPGPN